MWNSRLQPLYESAFSYRYLDESIFTFQGIYLDFFIQWLRFTHLILQSFEQTFDCICFSCDWLSMSRFLLFSYMVYFMTAILWSCLEAGVRCTGSFAQSTCFNYINCCSLTELTKEAEWIAHELVTIWVSVSTEGHFPLLIMLD